MPPLFITFFNPIHALSASIFRLKNRENCLFPGGGFVRNQPPRGVFGEGVFFFPSNFDLPRGQFKETMLPGRKCNGGGRTTLWGGEDTGDYGT